MKRKAEVIITNGAVYDLKDGYILPNGDFYNDKGEYQDSLYPTYWVIILFSYKDKDYLVGYWDEIKELLF